MSIFCNKIFVSNLATVASTVSSVIFSASVGVIIVNSLPYCLLPISLANFASILAPFVVSFTSFIIFSKLVLASETLSSIN
ncbi:MAG: hypothetical protein AMS24_01605 [Chlamydiae bacterium SM23_39]|nr:MAG: hypothetical protein AMS24_01605 [Chlamydiae bacterium SM23_39]